MATEHDPKGEIKDLDPVLDEYTDWFLQVVRRVFFPDTHNEGVFTQPGSFTSWLKAAEQNREIEPAILANLAGIHNDLLKTAGELLSETGNFMKSPTFGEFDRLATVFEEFINSIRRVSRDRDGEVGNLDPVTGLRTRDMFYRDIGRELDRLARQGKTFSLALIRIDSFEKIRQDGADSEKEACLKTVAAAIKKIARSFDDSYHMEEGLFIFSLKQTDSVGGAKAMHRLNGELEQRNALCKLKDGDLKLTVSSCVSEPLPDDNIRQLVTSMHKDLEGHAGEPGAVLVYQEISPLQQLLRESKK